MPARSASARFPAAARDHRAGCRSSRSSRRNWSSWLSWSSRNWSSSWNSSSSCRRDDQHRRNPGRGSGCGAEGARAYAPAQCYGTSWGSLRACGARRCGLLDWHPECRVCRKIDPMSACVNGLKPRETRVISNGDLRCHPIFTSSLVKHPMYSSVRAPTVRAALRRAAQRGQRSGPIVALAGYR